jgi:hypothetical protein
MITEHDNAGALAVPEMQARLAAVGCVGVRKDKTLLGELVDNISSRSHLPESFTMLPTPEDKRPVPSPVEKRIESKVMHNTHSLTVVLDNIVSAGDGIVQISVEYLLRKLGEIGTLQFIRSHNAMVRIYNVTKNAEIENVMIAYAVSQSLSLTKSEHQEYINRTPMIFKFLNSTKMGGITFRNAVVDWIQGDAVMADTGCDIMLITVSMAKGMNLPIVPSNTKVHTSVSGQSSVLGEVADNFDVILCKGTSDELVVDVGRDIKIW